MTHGATRDAAADRSRADRPWLPRWRVEHARAAGLLLVAAIGVELVAPAWARLGLAVQVSALVVAVALFGVPHGALDPLVGRRWLAPRLGARWRAPFHGGYLLLAGAVLVGWARAPAATLAAFLAASAVHFGVGDVAQRRAPRRLAWAEVLARGSAPIAVPALAHPAAVRQAFAWVAPGASATALSTITSAAACAARWIVVPACVLFAIAHTVSAVRVARRAAVRPSPARVAAARRFRTAHLTDALECLAVPAVAAVLPPFVAFLAYFCLLHSARHALALAASLDPRRPRRAWAAFARAALPATAATLALGAAAWAALARGGPGVPTAHAVPAAVRVLFAGLAALTAPHMLLTALAGEGVGGEAAASSLPPRPVQLVAQRAHRDA